MRYTILLHFASADLSSFLTRRICANLIYFQILVNEAVILTCFSFLFFKIGSIKVDSAIDVAFVFSSSAQLVYFNPEPISTLLPWYTYLFSYPPTSRFQSEA